MCQCKSKKEFGRNMLLLFLVVIVAGCATNPPDKVDPVESVSAEKFSIDGADEMGPGTQLDSPKIDTIVQYGSDETFNDPVLRRYTSKGGEYSLDFVNIAIEDFISIVFTDMLKTNYVLDSAIKGTVNVQTRGQINSAQLLSIVESVLASKNAVLIDRVNHYELVPLAKAKSYSFKPELYSARKIKPGYRMVVLPVNFVNPEDLKAILESVAPAAGHLKVDKERRAVIVTGTDQEITNVVDTVHLFDVSWLKTKSVAVLPIENTQVSLVRDEVSKILTSQNKTHDIVLDTLERFNALLVVAAHKNEVDSVRSWVKILDVKIPTADTQLFVYRVQNRKASELTDILNGIYSEEADISSSVSGNSDTVSSTDEVIVTNKKIVKRDDSSDLRGSSMRFVADETNNSIIILAKEAGYEIIAAVIADLDVLPLQVLIEVSIVEVSLTDDLSYGVEWFLKRNGVADKFNTESLLDLGGGEGIGPQVPGFSFALNGTGTLVQGVFNTLAAESKLNVISSPSLMALDNHSASIRVGDQQPVATAATSSANNDVLTQSIEYKSTGVLLTVTPRVNSGGLVTMELVQEVTDVGNIDDATGQRSFLQRNINSTVAVQDGSTIVLGGLITENKGESESGIPFLHKIPYLGGLFGKSATSSTKRELIVLITPKVVANNDTALEITREYADKMQTLKSSVQVIDSHVTIIR